MPDSTPPALADLLAHTRWVEALAQSLVRDPSVAADLAQSTLLLALEQSAPPANVRAWLAQVMRNLLRERFRREASRRGVESRGARAERLPGSDELVERAEFERRIVAAVLALDEPHRGTLLLRYFEELRPEEIARRSGLPLSTVSGRITRAHAALRARLGDEDPRSNWLAALTPILTRKSGSSPVSIHRDASDLLRYLLMSTTSKVLIAVAIGTAILWFALREHPSNSSDIATAALEAPPAAATPAPTDVSAPLADERQPVADARAASEVAKPETVPPPATPTTGRIHGQVFRPDGRPAPQRKVRLIRSVTGPEKYATTDDEGKFDERELGPGLWSMSTWPDKVELEALGKGDEDTIDGFTFLAQRTLELAAGADVEVILGKPPEAGVHATGRLTLSGASLKGYMTWMPDGKGSMDRQKVATASEEKGYGVLLDGPGRYLVIAIHDEARVEYVVDVPANPEFARDFAFSELKFAGKLVDATGRPVVDARVDLTPRSGINPRHPASNITYSHSSDKSGVFTFSNIPPAHYALGVHAGTVGDAKEPVAARAIREVDLSAGNEIAPLEIVLEPGAIVSGVVRSNAKEIAYADVFVIDDQGEPLNPLAGVQTKKDGTFELFALAPGIYRVLAAGGATWSEMQHFTVPVQGDAPKLELELKPAAMLTIDITGHQPAWIDVRDSSGVCLSALFDKHLFNRALTNDWSPDRFVFRGPPGDYRVAVVGTGGRVAEQKVVALAGESLAIDLGKH